MKIYHGPPGYTPRGLQIPPNSIGPEHLAPQTVTLLSGGGGNLYTPPTTATLPYGILSDGTQVVDSKYGSLVLVRPLSSTAPRWSGRFQTYDPVLATYIAGLSAVNVQVTELSFGISAYRSNSNKFAMYGVLWTNSESIPRNVMMTTDSGGTIIHTWMNSGLRLPSPVFFTLRTDGTNLYGGYGMQPDATHENANMPIDDLNGQPTHYGIWLGWGNTTADRVGQGLSCIHWQVING